MAGEPRQGRHRRCRLRRDWPAAQGLGATPRSTSPWSTGTTSTRSRRCSTRWPPRPNAADDVALQPGPGHLATASATSTRDGQRHRRRLRRPKCSSTADPRCLTTTSCSPRRRRHLVRRAGRREHAFAGLKTLADAVRRGTHILQRFEAGRHRSGAGRPPATLTFVVAGGGPTGVELGGALSGAVHARCFPKDYPEPRRRPGPRRARRDAGPRARAVPSGAVASRPDEPPARRASRCGSARRSVAEARPTRCASTTVRCRRRTLVWAAGVQPSPLVTALGLDRAPRGGVVVGPRPVGARSVRRCSSSATSPSRPAPGRPAAPAGAGGDAGRPPRRPPDRAPAGRPGDRQPSRSTTGTRGRWPRSAAGPRWPSYRAASGSRRAGVAGLARAAPGVPRGDAQPARRAPELGLELPHLGPWSRILLRPDG